MAANSQTRGLARLGKRFVGQISSRDTVAAPLLSLRRGVHTSIYDKNHEEHHYPTVVPDYLIPPQPEIYWSPHPQTGVFGPAADHTSSEGSSLGTSGAESVLEQKAFFRHQEDLDKPAVHP